MKDSPKTAFSVEKSTFWGLVCLFLIVRVPVILSSGSFILDYLGSLNVGLISKEIISNNLHTYLSRIGTSVPGDYVTQISLLTLPFNIITLPFILFLGDSLFAFRLATLAISLGTLVLLYRILSVHFNRRTAVFAVLLYIFSPPVFVEEALKTTGYHFTVIFFIILTLFIFYKIIFLNELIKNKTAIFALFGLACGFSLYVDYIFILTFAIYIFIITVLLFSGMRIFTRKSFFISIVSFLIGLSPWIFLRVHGYLLGFRKIAEKYSGPESFYILSFKLKAIFLKILPALFYFDNGLLKGNLLGWAYYFIFIISFIWLIWEGRKPLINLIRFLGTLGRVRKQPQELVSETFFFTIYIIAFIPILFFRINDIGPLFSYPVHRDPRIGWISTTLSSLFPVIFISIAIFLDKIWVYRKEVSFFLLACLVSFGAWGSFKLIDFNNPGMALSRKGYSHLFYGWSFNPAQVEERYRKSAYFGYGAKYMLEIGDDYENIPGVLDKIDERYRKFFIAGLGFGTLDSKIILKSYDLEQFCVKINGLESKHGFPDKVFTRYAKQEEYKRYFSQGVLIGVRLLFGDGKANEFTNKMDQKSWSFLPGEDRETQIKEIMHEVF
jgi:hypothetical protein